MVGETTSQGERTSACEALPPEVAGSRPETFDARALQALIDAAPHEGIMVTVGDRRGRVRDAGVALGRVAVSVDLLPSESERPGPHVQGDVRDLASVRGIGGCVAFMPCEQ